MRETRFRAWDKKGKKMGHVVVLSFDGRIIDGKPVYPDRVQILHEDYEGGSEVFNIEDVELMQDTGLKDKNGKEIYEGDIVKTNSRATLKIYWNDRIGAYGWIGNWKEEDKWDSFEIIGNIYSNPELLK